MNSPEVLYFDAASESPVKPEWDWSTDPFPPLSSLVWLWRGRLYSAKNEEDLAEFIEHCYEAPLLCGFNCRCGVSLIKAEILAAFGREYYEEMAVGEALDKRKRIDLMLASKKWVDSRAIDGRLKNPTLEELYSRCFPGQRISSEIPGMRVTALQNCLPRLALEGLIELRQREYPKNAKNGPISQV